MSTISNLYIDQGSDFATIVYVTSAVGTPLNLTNYDVRSQMSKSYTSKTVYDITAAIEVALDGSIRLTLFAAQNELIPAGRYLYDVEITEKTTGAKKRVVEGLIILSPQITRIVVVVTP